MMRAWSLAEALVFTSRDELVFKIIVIGDPGVGKKSLLNKISKNRFDKNYILTVGVNLSKEQVIVSEKKGKNLLVNLMFWNIAGQQQFYNLHRPYLLLYVFILAKIKS